MAFLSSKSSADPSKAENLKKRSSDGEGRKKDGKTKKKKQKLKQAKEASKMTHKSPLETTATSQGQIMVQVLSTFNRLEQSRFEAFRRSTFSANAISKYVAQCLIERHPTERNTVPILSHLCAPGQANEVTIIVSTLAKIYAQRLCTEARRFTETNQPVEPQHVLKAFEKRRSQGLDPGLFLQPAQSATATVLEDNSFERRRLAALQLQKVFDRQTEFENKMEEDSNSDTKMNEDSPDTQQISS